MDGVIRTMRKMAASVQQRGRRTILCIGSETFVSRARQLLAVVVSLLVVAGVVPALAAAADSSPASVPDAPVAAQPVPGPKLGGIDPVVGDYRALRTKYSSTFPGDHGVLKAMMYTAPVNYQDANGNWQPIDNTMVPASANGVAFTNKGGVYQASLPSALGAPVKFQVGNVWASQSVGRLSASGAANGRSVNYADTVSGVSVNYTAANDRLTEQVVLNVPASPTLFTYHLAASPGLHAVAAAGGGVDFVDNVGARQLSLEAPVVWDASGSPSLSESAVSSVLSSDGSTLTVSVDPSWLADPSRTWPVTIDPSSYAPSESNNCSLNSAAPTTSSCNNTTFDIQHTTAPKTLRELFTFALTLPHASNIQYADLNVPVATTTSGTDAISVHALTRAYTTAATWNTYDGVNSWTTAGGDFNSTATYKVTKTNGIAAGTYVSWNVTPLLQGWTDGSIANNGLLMKLDNETVAADYTFNDRGGNGRSVSLGGQYFPRIGQPGYFTTFHQQLDDRLSLDVNPATGNMELTSVDLPMTSVGPDISVVRYFNSLGGGYNSNSYFGGGWYSGPTDAEVAGLTGCAVTGDGSGMFEGADGWLAYWSTTDDTGSAPVTAAPGLNAKFARTSCTSTATFNGSQAQWISDGSINGAVLTGMKDRNGRSAAYTQASWPDLTVTDVEGRSLNYTGGGGDIVTQISDPTGARTLTYTYDATSTYITQYQDAAGNLTKYQYNASGDMTMITDPNGQETILGYDTSHRLTSLKRVTNNSTSAGYTWTFNYSGAHANDAGGTSTITDPNSHVTTYTYDTSSRVTQVQDANLHTQQSTYTANGDPKTLTNALSAVTTLNYDTNNNLTSLVNPASGTSGVTAATWTNRYSTTGVTGGTYLPSSTTDPQSGCTAYKYDPVGNLTNAYAGQTGNCDTLTGGSNFTNAYQGDTGVASCTSDALTTTYKGILCSTTFPNQAGTSNQNTNLYTFASATPKTLNSLDQRQPGYSCSTPRKLCQTETFDTLTRLVSVTDSSANNAGAGEKTFYCRDSMDRVTKVFYVAPTTTPNCTTGTADIAYTYDKDGNLTQRVDSTGTTTFAYDDLNRVVTKNTGTNVCTVTVQTPTGSVIYNGTVCMNYDGVNVTSFVDSSGTTAYAYDPANNLTSLVEPGGTSGCKVSPKTLTSLCTSFAYDSANRRTTTQYPGGANLVNAYDNAGNITSATGTANAGGTPISKYSYCYQTLVSGACPTSGTRVDSALVQQVIENDTRTGTAVTTDYLYDPFDRICSAASTSGGTCTTPPTGANKYAYDASGNRTSQTVAGTSTWMAYNAANELCWKSTTSGTACATPPTGATTYTFDNVGNLSTSATPTSSYTYNTKNQTTAITNNGVTLSAMAYADLGQTERTSVTQGANTSTLLSSPLGVDKTTTGATSTYVVRDPDGHLIGYKDGAGNHWYYLTDNQGSVVDVVNSDGSTIGNRYAYDEYGRSIYTYATPTVTQPWGYAGGYSDATGLVKFGARYYDPSVGRWTQQDPVGGTIGSSQSLNRYSYVGDNPLNYVDATGRSWWSRALVGFGAAVLGGSFCFAVGVAATPAAGFACGVVVSTGFAALPGPS
jgi:RHS repeat-associated protein